MLIVLEGVDGSGKSTLAQFLSNLLNAEIIHATAQTPNTFEWFEGIMNRAMTKNIIADRFFWGQFVYQEPEDRHITKDQLHQLEAYLKGIGVIVYVEAPLDTIKARLDSRGERTEKSIETLTGLFERRVWSCSCPVIVYDTSSGESSLIGTDTERRIVYGYSI